jgi:2'-5' RNA ligase
MEPLRLFIALELDDAMRAALKRAQVQLQDEKNNGRVAKKCVRWVAPQNLHLTLKFLGNSNPSHLPTLQRALTRIAENTLPFQLCARGLGCFPNAHRPNNVWVGLEGDVARAALLVRQIDDACAALGFARDERGFTPHLTLGRVKREVNHAQRAALGEHVARFAPETYGEIRARSIALISSNLRPDGPVYTIVSEHFFKEPIPA